MGDGNLDDLFLEYKISDSLQNGKELDISLNYYDWSGRRCNISYISIPIKELAQALKEMESE